MPFHHSLLLCLDVVKDPIPAIVFPLPVERPFFKDMPGVNDRILLDLLA
jgi:hypothetical protein